MFKKFFIILLLTVLAARPTYFVGTVVYYETHLNEIVEKYCVNKDKPQLQCNGKCHLAKQLTQANSDDTSVEANLDNISTAFFPVYFHPIPHVSLELNSKYLSCVNLNYTQFYHYLLVSDNDRPPIS
ncbi:hypothetical protein ACXGQW_01720 [Wenyingzhuangia sp. IMCC45533]